ncbi:MAG: dihydrolipoyllysine-residue succinyltransferase [Verrucomicrobia bacterium]|nr:dihydrolipoyllysine-residue succinyltransferase [Verrucomicrobiota bacterium]MDA1006234.1 dihydrolipoyllysine-residue succinyltransferase [Verrucomicrobiota bacterium]
MAYEVKIPPAGESIATASVAQWHKADGEQVKKGDVLLTVETDKVSTELEAEVSGTLKILVPEGEEVDIGTLVAEIEEGEVAETAAEVPKAEEPKAEAPKGEAPKAEAAAASEGAAEERVVKVKVPPAGESINSATIATWHKRDGEAVAKGEVLVTLDTDKVSTELEADESGVLHILTPEGAEVEIGAIIGELTVGGVAKVAATPGAAPAAKAPAKVKAAAPAAAPVAAGATSAAAPLRPDLSVLPATAVREEKGEESDGRTTRKKMSMLRRKIATQLVNVQQTAAILTTFNEADMAAVMKLRKAVQEDFVAKHGVKLGFMSFFVKAVVQGLKEVQNLNARVDGNDIVQNHFFDVGVAVGTEKGLVVPVIRDADQKGFAEIEQDILAYALKARDGKIQLEDLRGGGFTISNGGVYGSLLSTPILNPPQSGILGMHTIQQRPVAVDGKVEIRPMMYLALSYDHRIVDGKEAVTFLIKVKDAIENPERLMLEI